MKKSLLICILFLQGCTSPMRYTDQEFVVYDKHTKYAIENSVDGFDITVRYARYQAYQDLAALTAQCKSATTAVAWEMAERRGVTIEPINEQKILISTGNNVFTGISSCEARAEIKTTSP